MIFSEAVIESPVDCFNEHAALNGVAADWNERFEAGDDQIKPVKLGRLEGREYRGKGKDGMAKWVRVFVDPVSRITYFVGCCGSDSFIERPTSAAFLNSLQVIR